MFLLRKLSFFFLFFPVVFLGRGNLFIWRDWSIKESVIKKTIADPYLIYKNVTPQTWEKIYGMELGEELIYYRCACSKLADYDGERYCFILKVPPKALRKKIEAKGNVKYRGDYLFLLDEKKSGPKREVLWWGKKGWVFEAVKLVKGGVWVWVDNGGKKRILKINWKAGDPPPPKNF